MTEDLAPSLPPYIRAKADKRRLAHEVGPDGQRLAGDGAPLEAWVRLRWDLTGGRTAAAAAHGAVLSLDLIFDALDVAPGDAAWLALLAEPPGGGARILRHLWRAEGGGAPPRHVRTQIPAAAHGSALHLALHLTALSRPVHVAAPRPRWSPAPAVLIDAADVADLGVAVRGRACDLVRPGAPVALRLLAGERVIDQGQAADAPDPAGYRAFALAGLRLPDEPLRLAVGAAAPVDVAPTPALPRPAPIAPDETARGAVERVEPTRISGWALCAERPDAPVDLVLEVDGTPLLATRADRPRRAPGEGFKIDLPPGVAAAGDRRATLRPAQGRNAIEGASFTLAGAGELHPATRSVDRRIDAAPGAPGPISAVVLNRDGAALLDALLLSAHRHEDPESIEWIVLDHGSRDRSESVCAEAAARGQRVRWTPLHANPSFSASNNHGARLARHDVVAFLNNDLELTGPIAAPLRAALAAPDVGAVGAQLIDLFDDPALEALGIVQHLGVHLSPRPEGGWLRPYEARLTPETADAPGHVVRVPAATGALLAMRRDRFLATGGFDEGYAYGLEDVDLCLRLAAQGLDVACDGRVRVGHRRGVTRSSDPAAGRRQAANAARFSRRWGPFARRMVRRDLLVRPAHWTGVRPTIGIAADPAGRAATEAARTALQGAYPAHVRVLDGSRPGDLDGIDLLLVPDPRFDLAAARGAGAFLRTARIGPGPTEDLSAYDHAFDAMPSPAALAAALAAGRPRIGLKSPAASCASDRAAFERAEALAAALRAEGFTVRIDGPGAWDAPIASSDDAAIVLRGGTGYRPELHQASALWITDAPDGVAPDELAAYDEVWCASPHHAALLAEQSGRRIDVLAPAALPIPPEEPGEAAFGPVLLAGRPASVRPRAALWTRGLGVEAVGVEWSGVLARAQVRAAQADAATRAMLYRRARAVVVEHPEAERRMGYLSPLALEVLAAGGRLVTDRVTGIEELLPKGGYDVFEDEAGLRALLADPPPPDPAAARWAASQDVADRAGVLAARLRERLAAKPADPAPLVP